MSNTLPALTSPDSNVVDLPAHVFAVDSHMCVFCGESPIWPTYAAYVEHFYRFEFEGDAGHAPDDRELWEYLAATCLG